MRYTYRCRLRRSCGKSTTLRKPIEEYKRTKLCPGCKRDTLKEIGPYERARAKKRTCTCDRYSHPHRKGCTPLCIHAKGELTEADQSGQYEYDAPFEEFD